MNAHAKDRNPRHDEAKPTSLSSAFGRFASRISTWAGHPASFAVAVLCLVIWAASGPFLNYSTGWQLTVNTCTTICTFLMVFVIQNSQNRDGLAAQIKLDEIIRAIEGARNDMIDLEHLGDEELSRLQHRFSKLALKARNGSSPCDTEIEDEVDMAIELDSRNALRKRDLS